MAYSFDDHLDYILNDYYAEYECDEEVVYNTYMVFYTYADGVKYSEIMDEGELYKDYEIIFEDDMFENLIKYEVYNVLEDGRGYKENELLYSEEF